MRPSKLRACRSASIASAVLLLSAHLNSCYCRNTHRPDRVGHASIRPDALRPRTDQDFGQVEVCRRVDRGGGLGAAVVQPLPSTTTDHVLGSSSMSWLAICHAMALTRHLDTPDLVHQQVGALDCSGEGRGTTRGGCYVIVAINLQQCNCYSRLAIQHGIISHLLRPAQQSSLPFRAAHRHSG